MPLGRSVALWSDRAVARLPVASHVPGVCAGAFGAIVSVTDSLNPAKAGRRPTEQRAKPIKTRELKKADREVDFVFIDVGFLLFEVHGVGGLNQSYRLSGAR